MYNYATGVQCSTISWPLKVVVVTIRTIPPKALVRRGPCRRTWHFRRRQPTRFSVMSKTSEQHLQHNVIVDHQFDKFHSDRWARQHFITTETPVCDCGSRCVDKLKLTPVKCYRTRAHWPTIVSAHAHRITQAAYLLPNRGDVLNIVRSILGKWPEAKHYKKAGLH